MSSHKTIQKDYTSRVPDGVKVPRIETKQKVTEKEKTKEPKKPKKIEKIEEAEKPKGMEEIKEMEEPKNIETKEPEEKNKTRTQLTISVVVNLTLLSCGLCYSWAEFRLSYDRGAWEVVALPIGAILGSIVSGSLLNVVGRKWPLYVANVPLLAYWILLLLVQKWSLIFTARFIAGVAVGTVYTTVPIYLGELIETRLRGLAIGMIPVLFNIGYMIMSSASPGLTKQWMVLISLVPAALSLLSSPWVAESPYYDLMKNKDRCATLTLIWTRRNRKVEVEIQTMQEYVVPNKAPFYKELFTNPSQRKALLIVLLLFAAQQLSGSLIVQLYSNGLFRDIRMPVNDIFVLSTVSLAIGVASAGFVDLIGRRPLFLISSYSNALSLLGTGAYALVVHYKIANIGHLVVIPICGVILQTISFAIGLAPIPHIVAAELFAMNTKSWAHIIANVLSFLLSIIMAKSCQPLIRSSGFHYVLLAFGAIQLVLSIVSTIFMPETKQKSFADIQKSLTAG